MWRIDEWNYYSYFNCIEEQIYAPNILDEKINFYLSSIAWYRTKEVRLAAPFGYVIYYDDHQYIPNSLGYPDFNYIDFQNLSKLDWPIGMEAFNDQLTCGKSGEPYKSPVFAADPDVVSCFVPINPFEYGHKSCLTPGTLNYYIAKSIDIYDALRPIRLEDLFSSFNIRYQEPISIGDPIEHIYKFFTKKAKARPGNASIL